MVQLTSSPVRARILLEDGVAFGLADLLKDHLLGGLGGDAAQGVGVLGDAHFAADFHFGIDAPRLAHGHFMHGIFDGFDGFLHRIEFDRSGFGIHVRDVIFVGAIVLPSGNQHGVLDRVEHDLRVDAFFLAQDFDGLKNCVQSALLVSVFRSCLVIKFAGALTTRTSGWPSAPARTGIRGSCPVPFQAR